ncbi:MutS-related protein [Butyrivibrio sp. AC2005]|uniref:MutS-related protein n=1 Tax=Butyrivibrio sp. AC2005 TaxID=1280672 RepID=UPI0004175345|nr:DNA mismatch repair protein [Butyrivibrio sp. AC2005]
MPNKISLLFPNQSVKFSSLPDTIIHDIGMDNIISKLSGQQNEQTYIKNVMKTVTADSETAMYRADIFDDLMKNKKMRDNIMVLLDRINFLKEYGSYKHDHDHDPGVWDLLHRLDEIHDYIDSIEALYNCLNDADLGSKGLTSLKEYVSDLYNDNCFGELQKDISELKADTGNLKSVTVGINLNERFEASGIGIVSINSKPFTKSNILSHFSDKITKNGGIKDTTEWSGDYHFEEFSAKNPIASNNTPVIPMFSPLAFMSLKAVSEADETTRSITNYMDDITDKMLKSTVRHLRDVLSKYTMLTITDITDLMPEFIYYIRWVEYIEKLTAEGYIFCKPVVNKTPELSQRMDANDVYNMKLIGSLPMSDIVVNNLIFDSEHSLYILTGANRGGKTTITQTIGQLFFMAQGGIYVTGSSFTYEPVDSIFTHFPADEDKTMDLGRLGEECKRFKEIYGDATKSSLLLLNETFSTTSFEEGYFIAKDCVKAILKKGIRTIYNTHMHKLAYDIDAINDTSDSHKAASLIVCSEGGNRSYEVKIAPPEGNSYANDIAQKYGVTLEQLTSNE